jgi:hypothetical protein
MDLVTLKQYLGIDATTTDRDTLLSSLSDSALTAISNELGYSVASHAVIQQCAGSSRIAFTDLPATSLVVKYRGTLTDTGGTTDTALVAWTDYYVYTRNIELLAYRCSDPRIILTYNAGWSTLPEPIEQAMRLFVKYNFQGLDKLQAGEMVDTRMPKEIASLLAPYRALALP